MCALKYDFLVDLFFFIFHTFPITSSTNKCDRIEKIIKKIIINASLLPIKRITFSTKIGNDTFPTSTIETADFGHYRFFKCRPHFLKIWKNYAIRVFSRHIIDEKLNFILEFFHRKSCMQKFVQCTEVSLDKTKCCEFFQIFPTVS